MTRKCNILYAKNQVFLGSMTFLEPQTDGEYTAIIHRIDTIIEASSPEEAMKIGEELIDSRKYDCYLVPSIYAGNIISNV